MSDSDEEVVFEKRGLFAYEDQIPFDKRFAEATRIVEKYPDRIPLVCERVPAHIQKTTLPMLSKKKFLVPGKMSLAQFAQVIKKQVEEEASSTDNTHPGSAPDTRSKIRKNLESRALYFMMRNRQAPAMTKTLAELYSSNQDDDGFLYLHFGEENIFGES